MVPYSSQRPLYATTPSLFSLARVANGPPDQDKRVPRVRRMIYWEITLRDHLLLPITPDSSGEIQLTRHGRALYTAQNGMERDAWYGGSCFLDKSVLYTLGAHVRGSSC